MSNEEKAKESIYQFLKETSGIFNRVKNYAILIEQKLEGNKAPVHPANELKSLVFHLYNTAAINEHTDTNILEAKEHLCRAFYDLHTIIISIYKERIENVINSYKSTTVAAAFPEYGSVIRPQIRVIQDQLREIRISRNTDISLLNADIFKFDEQISVLEKFDDITEGMKTEMNKYDAEKKTEAEEKEMKEKAKEEEKRRKDKKWDITKILITAAVTALITLFITNRFTNSKTLAAPPQSTINLNDTTQRK
jgi:hypothetical protein